MSSLTRVPVSGRAQRRDASAGVEPFRRRWWPERDPDRPHLRLGLVWFAVLVVALVLGPAALALAYGAVGGVAALQTARAWWRRGERPAYVLAGLSALALPVGALVGWGVGMAILVGVALSVLFTRGPLDAVLVVSGFTIRTWLFVGVAAAAPVVVMRLDVGAAVALVLLACAYDAGDFLFGVEARSWYLGPLAGVMTVGVVSFLLYVIALAPFEDASLFVYAAVFAVLAPVGQLAASLLLPDGNALAGGLRRLDSLLVAGPVWAVLIYLGIGIKA